MAIAAYGADDTPRLVYADWLDENCDAGQSGWPQNEYGCSARAEFIRIQVERSRLSASDKARSDLMKRELLLRRRHRDEWEDPFWDCGFRVLKYERGLFAAVRDRNEFPGPKGWRTPAFLGHAFAGVTSLWMTTDSVEGAEFAHFISSPYLASLRRVNLPPFSDAVAKAITNAIHLSGLEEISFAPSSGRLAGSSTQRDQLSEAERLVAHIRGARTEAAEHATPTPLPALRAINSIRLPPDLLPFRELVKRTNRNPQGRV